MTQLRQCPEARRLLGEGIGLRVLGCMSTGSASCGDDSGEANFSYPVAGAKASGDYRFFVTKTAGGPWVFRSGTLRVGEARADVASCGALPQGAAATVSEAPAAFMQKALRDAQKQLEDAVEAAANRLRGAQAKGVPDAGAKASQRRKKRARALQEDTQDDDPGEDAGGQRAPLSST